MGYSKLMRIWRRLFACLAICWLATGCAAAAIGAVAQVANLALGGGAQGANAAASAARSIQDRAKDAATALNQAANTPVLAACTSQLSKPAEDAVSASEPARPTPAAAKPESQEEVASDIDKPAPACGLRRVCLPGRTSPTTMHVCERHRENATTVVKAPEGGIANWAWTSEVLPDQSEPAAY